MRQGHERQAARRAGFQSGTHCKDRAEKRGRGFCPKEQGRKAGRPREQERALAAAQDGSRGADAGGKTQRAGLPSRSSLIREGAERHETRREGRPVCLGPECSPAANTHPLPGKRPLLAAALARVARWRGPSRRVGLHVLRLLDVQGLKLLNDLRPPAREDMRLLRWRQGPQNPRGRGQSLGGSSSQHPRPGPHAPPGPRTPLAQPAHHRRRRRSSPTRPAAGAAQGPQQLAGRAGPAAEPSPVPAPAHHPVCVPSRATAGIARQPPPGRARHPRHVPEQPRMQPPPQGTPTEQEEGPRINIYCQQSKESKPKLKRKQSELISVKGWAASSGHLGWSRS